MDKIFGQYCGNKTAGKNLHVTGDRVKLMFYSDGEIERRGYLLNFTLVSLSTLSSGKWRHKEADKTLRVLLPRGESRGRVQGVCTLPFLRTSLLLRILVVYLTSQLRVSLVVHPS